MQLNRKRMPNSYSRSLIFFIILHETLIKLIQLVWIAGLTSTSFRSKVSINVCTTKCWTVITCRDVYEPFHVSHDRNADRLLKRDSSIWLIFGYVVEYRIWRIIALSEFKNLESSRFYKHSTENQKYTVFWRSGSNFANISTRVDPIELKFFTDIGLSMLHLP